MAKNNTGLVAYCEKALSEKWYYGWGSYGQKATASLVDGLIKQYPSMNTKWKDYMSKAVSAGTRLSDCYGLVKGYIFQQTDGSLAYNAAYDVNTGTAYARATQKGDLKSMPELPGIILYMPGHVGVYCGDRRFIECVGSGVGIRAGTVSNGKITSGSAFTNWFKDKNINYEVPIATPAASIVLKPIAPAAPPIQVNDLSIIIGNQEFVIKSILLDDKNYVELRPILSALGYSIEQTPYDDTPIVYPGIEDVYEPVEPEAT
ncbi:MAG: C40 family peptidase [Clostridiales bacterium]|jgi:hypothetical protein|nr:C40 family peptidase [Clostridiales bacterium]